MELESVNLKTDFVKTKTNKKIISQTFLSFLSLPFLLTFFAAFLGLLVAFLLTALTFLLLALGILRFFDLLLRFRFRLALDLRLTNTRFLTLLILLDFLELRLLDFEADLDFRMNNDPIKSRTIRTEILRAARFNLTNSQNGG